MADDPTITVSLEPSIKSAMDGLKESTGIPIAAQVRFGILLYLESHSIDPLKASKPKRQ